MEVLPCQQEVEIKPKRRTKRGTQSQSSLVEAESKKKELWQVCLRIVQLLITQKALVVKFPNQPDRPITLSKAKDQTKAF